MIWSDELLHAEQLRIEQAMHDGGVERYQRAQQRAIEAGESSATSSSQRLMRDFVAPVAEGVQSYRDHYKGRPGRPSVALKYLECLSNEAIAFIGLKVCFDTLARSHTVQGIAVQLGRKIEDQARFTKVEDAAPRYVQAIKETLKRARSKSYEHRQQVLAHAERHLASQKTGPYAVDIDSWAPWPKKDCMQIGVAVIDIILRSLYFQDEPVFRMHRDSKQSPWSLTVSAKVSEWVQQFDAFMSQLSPEFAPCVVKPRDWTGPKRGGYYLPEVSATLPLVKVNRRRHLKHLTKDRMPAVYKAVNALQSVAWEVNTGVLAVAQEVQRADLAIGMPQAEPFRPDDAPIPHELAHLRGSDLRDAMTEAQFAKFKAWKQEANEIYMRESTRAAQYIEVSRALNCASKYAQYPALYFVYTLDSRSRVYCRSSLIGPQGGDLQKALVRFQRAEKLGERGRYWLAVQGANVWGEDKCSFDERVAFIEAMSEDIRDIAADPVTFRHWAGADKPWQFLAWALEWAALLDWEDAGNRAEDFMSRIPVAMDGSCSGIQHYSAMLADKRGGAAVNLTKGDAPEDIYRTVADVVKAKMQAIAGGQTKQEFRSGGEVLSDAKARAICKAWLDRGFDRSMTKKPVMTLPYGSTLLTCRDSIDQYLTDAQRKEDAQARAHGRPATPTHPFGDKDSVLPKDAALAVATRLVWDSIGEVVVAARAAMEFIQKVARQVGKANMPMRWTTPTGFVVEQAVYKQAEERVKTQLMGVQQFTLYGAKDEIDPQRMVTSAAPNYVHSMDASHLMLSVNGFHDVGMHSIAVIHDSFGTHAGRTDELRSILRQTMRDMYQEQMLVKFRDEQEELMLEMVEHEVPYIGTLDLDELVESEYTFG